MRDDIFLSVIICSRNRAHELENCLPPLISQAISESNAEVIVIDNGSTDSTGDVVAAASAKLDYPLRYVFEGEAGLCKARNRGREEARGNVLAYIDDDAIVMDNWIAGILAHFRSRKSDILGGKVSIVLDGEMPFKLEKDMEWFFMASTLGEEPRLLKYPQHPTGCNMAFAVEVFDSIGGFNTNLKLYGDETDFFGRAYEHNFSMYYDPKVEVSQVIPSQRLTKAELREKSYLWGKGAATNWLINSHGQKGGLFRKKLEFLGRVGYMAIISRIRSNFGAFYTYWYNRGYLAQLQKGLDNK